MLEIIVKGTEAGELWDEEKCEFIPVEPKMDQKLQLEHSLISLSKWESKWCKPFYENENKTIEETLDYIRCMTLNKVDPDIYDRLDQDNLKAIRDYIYSPMTATTIREKKTRKNGGQKMTSELVYFWMLSNGVPFECDKWHFNRLITLLRICAEENQKPKKSTKRELASSYAELNAINRRKFNSKG